MTTTVTAPGGRLPRKLSAWLSRQPLSWWAIGLAGLALAVSGLFGGLAPVAAKPANPAEVGASVDGGAWKVTVTGARLLPDTPPLMLTDKANRWVVVLATVEITADRTWTDLSKIVVLSGTEGIVKPTPAATLLVRGDTVTRTSQLHPNMPEQVAFCWEQSGQAPVPTEITVTVQGQIFRPDSFDGRERWFADPKPRGAVLVPVQDRREA